MEGPEIKGLKAHLNLADIEHSPTPSPEPKDLPKAVICPNCEQPGKVGVLPDSTEYQYCEKHVKSFSHIRQSTQEDKIGESNRSSAPI